MRLTVPGMRRMFPASLLDPGDHETQMISPTLHINGAYTWRTGTASRVRNRFLGSAGRVACRPVVVMYGITTKPQGGRAP